MATTEEVTVSMGEVTVVKSKDDDECEDGDKAQVILQLQPIPVGYVTNIRAHTHTDKLHGAYMCAL